MNTEDLSKRYEEMGKLGEGNYGAVYLALDRETKELVAMKKMVLESDEEGISPNTIREISVLRELSDHPNIVKLKDVHCGHNKLCLIFEYLEHDLGQYLYKAKSIEPPLIKSFVHQILKGIEFCHAHRVLHRDLKPQNILISKDGRLKLADFGLSRAFSIPLRNYTHEIVTLWYRAPEILLGQARYSTPVDIWATGCIMAELVARQPLFRGDSEIDQLFRIFRTLGTPNDQIWPGVSSLPDYQPTFPQLPPVDLSSLFPELEPEGIDLLKGMLRYDPNKRLTPTEALGHPYFNKHSSQ